MACNRTFSNINWVMVGAIATVLLVVVGIIAIIQQCPTKTKPHVSVSMEYPIKVEEDKVYRNTRNPEIKVRNNGPVKAVSLSSDIKLYSYNKNKKKIVSYSEFGSKDSSFPLSAKELEPFDELKVSAPGVPAKKYIAAYVINVVFHRESDVQRFVLQKYFFTENKVIYTDDEFVEDERYVDVMEAIELFDPTKIKTHEVHFTPADDHTWFVESDAMHKIRKEKNGRLRIIGDPVPQSTEPLEGFPHLIITPHKFSKCDCYISAKIVEGHVEAKIQHKVSNVGGAVAGITENGFDVIKEIEPGKESFHASFPYRLESDDEKQLSAQEIYDRLMSGEDKIRAGVIIMYRPANDPGRLFSVEARHEFTPNAVRPIQTEETVNN